MPAWRLPDGPPLRRCRPETCPEPCPWPCPRPCPDLHRWGRGARHRRGTDLPRAGRSAGRGRAFGRAKRPRRPGGRDAPDARGRGAPALSPDRRGDGALDAAGGAVLGRAAGLGQCRNPGARKRWPGRPGRDRPAPARGPGLCHDDAVRRPAGRGGLCRRQCAAAGRWAGGRACAGRGSLWRAVPGRGGQCVLVTGQPRPGHAGGDRPARMPAGHRAHPAAGRARERAVLGHHPGACGAGLFPDGRCAARGAPARGHADRGRHGF